MCVREKYNDPFYGGLVWPPYCVSFGHLEGLLFVGDHNMVAIGYGQNKQIV